MKPVLQALVLAERIFEDSKTRRKIIAGTITELRIVRVSELKKEVEFTDSDGIQQKVSLARGGVQGSPYAYISLTDVHDNTRLELQFVSLTRNKVMFGSGVVIRNTDRLKTVEIVLALPQLDIPEPGTYAFEVICEGEPIGSARIVAREVTRTDSKDITNDDT